MTNDGNGNASERVREVLMVYLKAPIPGLVKTRLGRDLGGIVAAAIYRELAERQISVLRGRWETELHFTPSDGEPGLRDWLGDVPCYRPQAEGDLGRKLARGFESAFASGAKSVVAIGVDCPDLDSCTLAAAFSRLEQSDLVLGPARDGGYYLIGLRRPVPALFAGVNWSTPSVLADTLQRAARAGLQTSLLEQKEDVDDFGSWDRLVRDRAKAALGERLAVVIPSLNEEARISSCVSSLRERLPGVNVVVADASSYEATSKAALQAGAKVVKSARGRGGQCQTGAMAAGKPEWLLFLHADTELPANAAQVLQDFISCPDAHAATFRLRFDREGWFLRLCAWFTRFDSVFTRFGDQGILIRRSLYETLGGFPNWPLFEDVDLLRRVRTATRLHSLPACVTTSARRFQANGTLRQQCLNAWLLLRFLLGTPPAVLAKAYEKTPRVSRSDSQRLDQPVHSSSIHRQP